MRYGWHTDPAAWTRLEEHIRTLKWVRKPFDESFAYQVPQKAGVYIICAPPPLLRGRPHKELQTVIYAGRSQGDLRERFVKHLRNPDARLRSAIECLQSTNTSIHYYYAEASPEQVVEIEATLINCYGPPGNSQSGDTMKVKARVRFDKGVAAG